MHNLITVIVAIAAPMLFLSVVYTYTVIDAQHVCNTGQSIAACDWLEGE